MEKFEKPKKEKEMIIDIEIDEETEKEIFEKYEDLEFLIQDIGLVWEEFDEQEKIPTDEPADEDAGIPLVPEYFGLEIEDEAEREKVQKVILKKIFTDIGFDYENPKIIEERKEGEPGKEVAVKYFEITDPSLILSHDGTDWVVQKKERITKILNQG